ncbi:MAG: agmatine deiminase family protein [Gammaproteobacteria bacterium]|nr:agmatine deiminase family protein [Gammaproteobacteria bacterium]
MTRTSNGTTAREAGFRMPAEWEPHARCWMQWPHRTDFIWPDIGRTQLAYANVAKAIRRFEPVTMMVCEQGLANARALCGDEIDYFVVPLDDSWARDSGPIFVKRGDELGASIFLFNAWGRKYDRYNNDAALGHRVAEALGIRTFSANAFLEGGAIAVDGEGTIITAEQCMLNANRNPGMTRAEAERILCEALGGEKVIWVPGDPEDSETDGHIDALACFVRPGVVLCAVGAEELPERRRNLHENWKALEKATDARGRSLELIPLGEALEATASTDIYCNSYMNFYIANGGIVFPGFGTDTDQAAQDIVSKLFPGRSLAAVNVSDIAPGGGGIHCITQQQPA